MIDTAYKTVVSPNVNDGVKIFPLTMASMFLASCSMAASKNLGLRYDYYILYSKLVVKGEKSVYLEFMI